MNWLDIVLLLLILGVALIGVKRGFGRTLFDALALYAALCLASAIAPTVAAHFSLTADGASANKSCLFGLLFVVFGALGLGVAWYGHSMTNLDAGMFDKLFGLVAGTAAGMILAHSLVTALVTADPRREASAALVSAGSVGTELYSFPAYHATVETITGAASYRRELPNVGGK